MEFYFIFIVDRFGRVRSFTDSDLPDTDNIVPFENTTLINQNKNGQNISTQSRLIRLIKVVFSKGTITMLSVSDKSESVNERTHTDQQKIKLHFVRVRRKCR